MRVYERYPAWMRVYRGRTLPAFSSLPLRGLAGLYRMHLSLLRWMAGTGRSVRARGRGACVVSVGNIEVGGGGKTPCVIALAEALEDRALRPVVVTRGYGGEAEGKGCRIITPASLAIGEDGLDFISSRGLGENVIGAGGDRDAVARLIGDEAVLYHRRGIPLVVERKRARGIEIAERVFDPTHILLDDAFQHRGAARDMDIVLLDAARPFGNGRFIPAGSLREGPEALERADIIIFTRAPTDAAPREAERFVDGRPVFFADHLPVELVDSDGKHLPLDFLERKRIALVSGIARPESFETMVRSLGIEPEASFRFADHHGYTARDIAWIAERTGPGCMLVTTEKDWVKMARLFPRGSGPLALVIRMEIRGADRLVDLLEGCEGTPPEPSRMGEPTSS